MLPTASAISVAPAHEAAAPPADTPTAAAEEEEEEQTPAPRPDQDKVHIRYNHKNGLFKLQDGRLDFSLVDMQYCLSYVLKGDWSCHLKHDELGEIFLDGGKLRMGKDEEGEAIAYGTFSGLRLQDDDGRGGKKPAQYTLQIRQDPSIASAPRQAYKGSGGGGSTNMWREGSRQEGCSCLYGNPCAVPDFCKDWHNRFDVAKRNSGKGFPSVKL